MHSVKPQILVLHIGRKPGWFKFSQTLTTLHISLRVDDRKSIDDLQYIVLEELATKPKPELLDLVL